MPGILRSAIIRVVFATFAIVLLAWSTPALRGESQAQAPASGARPAPPTAAQLAPFLGDWALSMSMGATEAGFALAIKGDGGKASATITAEGQPAINVTDISAVGNNLILKFSMSIQGTPISSVLTLTPDGAGLRANMAIMDGQYEMAGSAVKQAPGAPVRATGFGGGGGRGRHEPGDGFHAEDAVPSAHAGRGSRRLHPADGLSRRARCRGAGRHQPDAHRVRRQRADVCRRDDQLHDGRRRQPRARAHQPHQPLGEHQRRRQVRQAHGIRRSPRGAAHDPARCRTA